MIVVISDLHLSEGRRDSSRKLARTEDFFFDDEFSRFLGYIDSLEPGGVRLVINGDLFDFLQVGAAEEDFVRWPHLKTLPRKERSYILKYGPKTDELSSILKLDKIHHGHPVFFEALRRFLDKGNRLTVVTGNHDIELFWPGVRERLRALLGIKETATAAMDGAGRAPIEFAHWIYYDRTYALYVEHGGQYESVNSFRYWLWPVLPKKDTEINLPFGSLFVRYLLNKVEEINPFADNIILNTKYVAWAIRNNPLAFRRLLKLLGRFILTLAKAYRRSGNYSRYDPPDIKLFESKTGQALADIAAKYDLPADTDNPWHPLRKVMALHRMPFNDGKGRFLGQAFLSYLDVLAFIISALAMLGFVALTWRFGIANAFSVGSLAISLLGILAGNLYYKAGASVNQDTLGAVKEISRIFKEADVPLRCVTLGHTHRPEITQLDGAIWYFNTGTWGVRLDQEAELIREKTQFAFLMLPSPELQPRLMRWDDARGAAELLPLFDSD